MKRAICFLSFIASTAAFADPAVHINDFGCGLKDGNGNFVFTTDSRQVITSGGPGVNILKCFADVTNNTGRAVHYSGDTDGACGTNSGITYDWHETVSANGKAILTCVYKN